MVAAAFKGIINMIYQDGGTDSISIDATDVAAALVTYGGTASTSFQFSAGRGYCWITDVILTAAGTDTKWMNIYVNDKDTGTILINGSNLGTATDRQFKLNKLGPIRPGARLTLTQRA